MSNYSAKLNKLKIDGSYVDMSIMISSEQELNYPRISACFYCDNDNRILPMDLKQSEKNFAVATGIFNLPYLFYDNSIKGDIHVKFLLSDGKANHIFVEPSEPINIKPLRKNKVKTFISSPLREKEKILFKGLMNFLFLPYKHKKVIPNQVTFLTNRSDRLTGNIKSVFYEMTKEQDVNIVVLSRKGSLKENIPILFKFLKLYATSRIVFVDDYYHFISYINKKKDVTLIQLWHACGAFKTFGFSRLGRDSYLRQNSPNHRQYDYVVVSSEDIIPYYSEGFGVSLEKVVALGSPRCDVLSNEKYKKNFVNNFYKKYPELNDSKILMFAPTFRGGGLGNCYYDISKFDINKLLDNLDEEWKIVVKMHPYLNERPVVSDNNKGRVYDFSSLYDINDLLLITDLIVTDYSSVIFEASLLNIPMLFFAYDLNEYSRDRDFYCNFSSFVPGKIVVNINELIESIKSKDYKQELVVPFKEKYFGDTSGIATKNVVEFTKELLNK